ncbi:outer membrane beta-barrel protein [Polynucleobacter sp. UB-Tiil-W10]|uniref:outer membrane beta-barrel protein n=1 Tax=Polynucleobacter sp. UB-Tiil-W10 TaxID=1855648 RepID=UPI001C0C4B5C|nr:outer membrane beta-barrel protein [Polynucleobacter sp. UB-Tiil-W10]MBU3541364.1 outer membrane beta-barrel protein [Polynucleobacter sp. UB-Tiil-W10]
MKKLLVASGVLLSTVVASQANAQSRFEGFYGQLGIGYENVSPTTSSTLVVNGVNVPTSLSAVNTNSFAGTATLGYTFAVDKDFLLGIGAEYSPIAGNSSNVTYNVVGYNIPLGTFKKKNSYNFFIAPSAAIGRDQLAYFKVGYTGAQIETTDLGGASDTTNYHGYSLGLGYKQFISAGLYGFGEVNYFKYSNQTSNATGTIGGYPASASLTSGASATNFIVGLGYKF